MMNCVIENVSLFYEETINEDSTYVNSPGYLYGSLLPNTIVSTSNYLVVLCFRSHVKRGELKNAGIFYNGEYFRLDENGNYVDQIPFFETLASSFSNELL